MNTTHLKETNSKTLTDGEMLPSVQLKDGTKAQTGSFAAMLHNITLYNNGSRGQVETELAATIPALVQVGIFDLFPPDEWIEGNNEGRKFIGEAASKYMLQRKQSVFPRFFYI